MSQSRILRDRIAGQSAMSQVVQAQRDAAPRGRLARIFGVSPLVPSIRRGYRDALGELIVGDILENLGQRWDVLHDLPLGDGVLDHLVIGPAGVFAVQVANHGEVDVIVDGDSISVGSNSSDDLATVATSARLVESILTAVAGVSVPVRGLVVVVEPKRLTVKAEPSVAAVVSSRDLSRALDKAPVTLTGDDVARISDIADLVSTWPAADEAALDTQHLHREFGAIRVQTRSALRRRLAWSVAAVGVACIATWIAVAALVSSLLG